jgi:hypothetical protein
LLQVIDGSMGGSDGKNLDGELDEDEPGQHAHRPIWHGGCRNNGSKPTRMLIVTLL